MAELIAPADLEEGDRVQALDTDGFWYDAEVVEKKGGGSRASVWVAWSLFPSESNAKYTAGMHGTKGAALLLPGYVRSVCLKVSQPWPFPQRRCPKSGLHKKPAA